MDDSKVIDLTDESSTCTPAKNRILENAFIDLSLDSPSRSSFKRKIHDMDITTNDVAVKHNNSMGDQVTSVPEVITDRSPLNTSTDASVEPIQRSEPWSESPRKGEEEVRKRQKVTVPVTTVETVSVDETPERTVLSNVPSLINHKFSDTSKYNRPESVVDDGDIIISDDEPDLLPDGLDPLAGLEETRVIIDLLDADDKCDPQPDDHEIVTDPIKVSKNGVVFTCAEGKTVEYRNGTFMQIERMVYNSQKQVVLIGKFLIRQNSFDAKVPKRRNEVIWLIDGIDRTKSIKSVWRIYKEEDILRNRRLIMTNRSYPRNIADPHHPRSHPDSYVNPTDDVNYGPLFCRMKLFCRTERGRRELEEIWEVLSESEADVNAKVDLVQSRIEWRGPTAAGGSAVHYVFNEQSEMMPVQAYTFGDSFCGAGGTSCGAKKAGLHIVWSFDADPKPLETYHLNFPLVDSRKMYVHEFIEYARNNSNVLVDVLHLSPPCQPFSPAHTVSNAERDEPNQAALLSVGSLLQEVKPRIVTLEQTLGLESRHPEWFRALINDFMRAGYSFHWRVVNCADYGVPQTRKRLIFLGAGPGERLPEFPRPTHGAGLKPLDTVRKVLEKVTLGAPNHDPTRIMSNPKPPYDPNTTAKTVTCNGGVGNYHPLGLRKFTVREFACFQTFPLNFKLADVGLTQQRKQVGNAVPPLMAETFYKAIIKSLKRSDGVV